MVVEIVCCVADVGIQMRFVVLRGNVSLELDPVQLARMLLKASEMEAKR
jgi:hypothetical protein